METVTIKDRELVAELIARGYASAAASFCTLVGQKVEIENEHVDTYTDVSEVIRMISDVEDCTILLTELIGDLIGESYLIFNYQEKIAISSYCMKAFGRNVGTKLDEEAILKEVDNIISAAVITEFSNALQVKTFGDVPKILTKEELEKDLKNENGSYFLLSRAHFIFENHLELNPRFLWRLDRSFLERARKVNN